MWALTQRPILNAEVLRALTDWKAQHGLHSDRWVLPRHVGLFGTRARADAPARLSLPASLLLADERPPCAVPLPSLPHRIRSGILMAAPPPPELEERTPIIVEMTQQYRETDCETPRDALFSPGDLAWRECTLEELFDAALPHCDATYHQDKLLCSAALVPEAPQLTAAQSLTLLNAQDTVNPFAVDPELAHRDVSSGHALPDILFSSLTTVACQFRYRSLQWAEVLSPARNAEVVTAALDAGVKPHQVSTRQAVLLAHISQLPRTEQETLIAAVPRYALCKAAGSSFVLHEGRWLPAFRLNLERRLRHEDIPASPLQDVRTQPLFWVSLVDADVPHITGDPLRIHRLTQRLFLNREQLRNIAQGSPDAEL